MGTYARFVMVTTNDHQIDTIEKTQDVNFHSFRNGEIQQSYDLFSWLSGVRDGLVTRFDKKTASQECSKFFQLYDAVCRKELIAQDPPGTNYGFGGPPDSDIKNEIGMWDRSCYIYDLEELLAFDYDEIAVTDQQTEDEAEKLSYRQMFQGWWFELLHEAKEKGCTHIIVGYD